MERGQTIFNYSGYILRCDDNESGSKGFLGYNPEINGAAPSVWLQAVFRRWFRRYHLNVA